jgi:hypothetical protein
MIHNSKLMDEEILICGEGGLGVDGTHYWNNSAKRELDLRVKNTRHKSRVLVFIAESHQWGHRVNENDKKGLQNLLLHNLPVSACP